MHNGRKPGDKFRSRQSPRSKTAPSNVASSQQSLSTNEEVRRNLNVDANHNYETSELRRIARVNDDNYTRHHLPPNALPLHYAVVSNTSFSNTSIAKTVTTKPDRHKNTNHDPKYVISSAYTSPNENIDFHNSEADFTVSNHIKRKHTGDFHSKSNLFGENNIHPKHCSIYQSEECNFNYLNDQSNQVNSVHTFLTSDSNCYSKYNGQHLSRNDICDKSTSHTPRNIQVTLTNIKVHADNCSNDTQHIINTSNNNSGYNQSAHQTYTTNSQDYRVSSTYYSNHNHSLNKTTSNHRNSWYNSKSESLSHRDGSYNGPISQCDDSYNPKPARDSAIFSGSESENEDDVGQVDESQDADDITLTGLVKRMSTNGSDRPRQHGSAGSNNDNITWRARATSPAHRAPETMLAGASRLHHDVGMYAAAHSDSSHRLYLPGSQYHYSTTPSTGLYSQAMYTIHGGQPSHLGARYPAAYYPQYLAAAQAAAAAAGGYGHGSIIPYPHFDSYSAVLASIGSQVQHGQTPQLTPRVPYLPVPPSHIPHYSGLASSGAKVPHGHKSDYSAKSPLTKSDTWVSPPSRGEYRERVLSAPSKHPSFYHPHDKSSASTSVTDSDYKVPSGKEGSMKHRILTRPPDQTVSIAHCDSSASTSRRVTSSDTSLRPSAKTSTSVNLHYPPHFMRGSIIELANSQLKCVEELQTEDFVQSADVSPDLKIDSSTVVKIEQDSPRGTVLLGFSVGQHRVQVTVEAALEHPFFVFGQGWSSCGPERTLSRYGLECQKLSVGDVCISLTHKDVISHAEALHKLEAGVVTTTTTATTTTTSDTKSGISSAGITKRAHIHFASDKTLVTTEPKTESETKSGDIKSESETDTDAETKVKAADVDLTLSTMTTRKRRWSAPDDPADDLVSPSTPPSLSSSSQQLTPTSTTVTTTTSASATTSTTSTESTATTTSSSKSQKPEDNNNNT